MLYLITRKYIKTQYSIKTLLELLTSEAQPEFKQMAVILLQKAIFKHFQGLGEADTKILRDTILKIYFESKIPRVKSILANLLAKIAEYYFSNEKVWPEVLNEISKRSEDTSNPDSLMDAIILLTNMLDSCDEYLKASYAQISSFLENVLKLNKPELTVEVLKCLSYIVGSLDDDELCKQYGYLFQTVMSVSLYLSRHSIL